MNLSMILLSAILVNNAVLIKSESVCPLIGASGSDRSAAAMSLTVLFTTLTAQAIIWPIHYYVIEPFQLHYLETISTVLVVAGLVQAEELLFSSRWPALRSELGIYLPLTAANGAILSVLSENLTDGNSFADSMAYALGTGLAFCLAMFLFRCIRMKLLYSDIPESFRGPASSMIAAAILALVFMGFSGLIEGLFGMGM